MTGVLCSEEATAKSKKNQNKPAAAAPESKSEGRRSRPTGAGTSVLQRRRVHEGPAAIVFGRAVNEPQRPPPVLQSVMEVERFSFRFPAGGGGGGEIERLAIGKSFVPPFEPREPHQPRTEKENKTPPPHRQKKRQNKAPYEINRVS